MTDAEAEAEIVEQVWRHRARQTRALNRRVWIRYTLLPALGWCAFGAAVLASLLFAVFVALFHGVTTPI